MHDRRVVNATVSTEYPGNGNMSAQRYMPGKKIGQTKNEIHCNIYRVDANYLSTLGIMVEGRNISPDFQVIVRRRDHQAAQRELGWSKYRSIGKLIVRSAEGNHSGLVWSRTLTMLSER